MLTITTMANSHYVLVLNCGSSSIKFGLFDQHGDPSTRAAVYQGKIERITESLSTISDSQGFQHEVSFDQVHPHREALLLIFKHIRVSLNEPIIVAIGHRVVHGGAKYTKPVLINTAVLEDLQSYIPLAPIHQPFALESMKILLSLMPDTPQIACFDTSFHQSIPLVEQVIPLPYWTFEKGIKRYGFHGLSYEYLSKRIAEHYMPYAHGKVIIAHLGSGASLCALEQGLSVATSMGFSALEGLMMGTRTGAIDPGAVLHLMEIQKLSLSEVIDMLYHQSGLLGVSGISSEPRKIKAYEDEDGTVGHRARLALDLYIRRIVREIGALIAVLGGLDMLVFTAGVGENNPFIRQRICDAFGFMGMKLDPDANLQNVPTVISAESSTVQVCIEPTNEEWMIFDHIQKMFQQDTNLLRSL